MRIVYHKADSRGHSDYGWLNSFHTFNFAGYRDPERIHFGALRVLNDDTVAPGMGFDTHPHDNMEIISFPLTGELKHQDSMGNISVISQGDLQVMSAGTGISHSEYNNKLDREASFLQIWIIPNQRNVKPRYDQISIQTIARENSLFQVLSPRDDDEGVWIHQDAWFSMGFLKKGWSEKYTLKGSNHGVYLFVIEGKIIVENQILDRRDGLGIWDTQEINIAVEDDSHLLLMEVPMINLQ